LLRQNTLGQAEILSAIERFRQRLPGRTTTLARARIHEPVLFHRLLALVEWKLIEMPLPRLQQLGDSDDRFVYEIGWTASVKRREVRDGSSFDNRIHLVGRAGEYLVQLSGLVRPLLQRQWAAMVARMNRGLIDDARLEEFLFGAERIALDPVRDDLRELQDDTCFYCECKLGGAVEVDHFLPWSRHADNGIENLVVADARCNGWKRDFLASAAHVEHWVERARLREVDLTAIAVRAQWEQHSERTFSVARAIYLRLPEQVRLWHAKREFVTLDRAALKRVF
jgi:hypothetical protein